MSILRLFFIFSLALTLALSACASKKEPVPEIPAFRDSASSSKINRVRYVALRETATSLGAQAGLAWRSQQINQMLERNAVNLDQSFNFRQLLLNDNVLPPVLAEGQTLLNLDSPDAIRLADHVYKIESPPRFVTAPPNWREYILMGYTKPDKPDNSLLPKNDDERVVWNEYVQVGWQEGLDQANSIFAANLGRLKRDFKGMVLYRKLLAANMVTPPYVAKAELGITGDENEMRVNDQVLRITATSKLQTDSKQWKATVTPGIQNPNE
jgi:defect-in-organelle-trafficking protein DotC